MCSELVELAWWLLVVAWQVQTFYLPWTLYSRTKLAFPFLPTLDSKVSKDYALDRLRMKQAPKEALGIQTKLPEASLGGFPRSCYNRLNIAGIPRTPSWDGCGFWVGTVLVFYATLSSFLRLSLV